MAKEADQEATAVGMVVTKVVDTEVVSAAQVAVEAEVVVVSAAADVAAEVVAVVAIIHTKKHLYIQIYSKQCVPFKMSSPIITVFLPILLLFCFRFFCKTSDNKLFPLIYEKHL